jgi:hypothetical protein
MIRKPAPLFILSFALLNACGGGSSGGGGGTPPPQSIVVTISSAPPASMMVGANQGVSANVTNDSANAGVTWNCTPANSCGTFNPTSTLSGANTTYTAPSTVPTPNSVVLIATSVTDKTKTAQSSPITITAPAPPPIVVSISTTPTPPATMSVSTTAQASTAQIAATVTNDSANAGVNWSCAPAPSCGSSSSFSPNPTPSGTATTYTAPSSVPTGGTVTLTAKSVTDPTKNASSSPILITGTASVASLKGQYAFIVFAPTGNSVTRGITTWEGSIGFDGAGNVLGGVEDIVAPKYNDQQDPILATGATGSVSAYTVDPSGHGTVVMSTAHGETLHMSFVVTSPPTHAVVIEQDGEPGSGTMDLQTPATGGFSVSQISGAYSFTMEGIDAVTTPAPNLSFGGTFISDGASNITSGTIDVNSVGSVSSSTFTGASGSTISTPPDTNGRGLMRFVPLSGTTPASQARTFIFYLVSSKVLRLLENDNVAFMGGSAYAQGSPGTTTLLGNYVYQHSGWNPATANPPTGRTVAAGEFSVASGSSTFSGGFSDANTGAAAPTTVGPGLAISGGSYAISATTLTGTLNLTDAAGVASTFNMYMVDPALNILDPNSTTGGGGALLLHTDTHINGTGILVPQQTSTAFLGNYALNLNNSIAATTPNELDLVGVFTGDGNLNFGGAANFALADYDQVNSSPTPILGAPLSGTFTMDSAHSNRATGTFTVNIPTGAVSPVNYPFIPGLTAPVTFSVAFYQVSNSEAFIIETDSKANVSGFLVLQQLP